MGDDSTKGLDNNIIKWPWTHPDVKPLTEKSSRLADDMQFIGEVTEGLMIPMIHNLSENGVDISSEEFIGEVGYMNEVLKSILYRHFGYNHPVSLLIAKSMIVDTEGVKVPFAEIDVDILTDILEIIEESEDEPNS